MRLEVDENNIIRIYRDGEDFCFFEQPSWPDGSSWASYEQAEGWGAQYLASLIDPLNNPEPPLYPGA